MLFEPGIKMIIKNEKVKIILSNFYKDVYLPTVGYVSASVMFPTPRQECEMVSAFIKIIILILSYLIKVLVCCLDHVLFDIDSLMMILSFASLFLTFPDRQHRTWTPNRNSKGIWKGTVQEGKVRPPLKRALRTPRKRKRDQNKIPLLRLRHSSCRRSRLRYSGFYFPFGDTQESNVMYYSVFLL